MSKITHSDPTKTKHASPAHTAKKAEHKTAAEKAKKHDKAAPKEGLEKSKELSESEKARDPKKADKNGETPKDKATGADEKKALEEKVADLERQLAELRAGREAEGGGGGGESGGGQSGGGGGGQTGGAGQAGGGGGGQTGGAGNAGGPSNAGPTSGGPPGQQPTGDLASWIAQAKQILQQEGIDVSKINDADLALMIRHESGGNPHAQNNTDSNARAGHPSKGIMQTIDSTFNANAVRGHTDIWNPVDNIVAGVRYAIRRYGSIDNVPGVKAVHQGRPYVGY